ncbi:MAG: DUF1223 domain-containing protein [Pseudomonadota bacterium]
MRRIIAALTLSLIGLGFAAGGTPAEAQNTTVVELYTSQGCSSCPPADKLLHEIAKRDNVIALALHVDYWDYIGWKDEFADPRFTERQKAYARAAGARSIYTPQMIIGGLDHVVGTKPSEVTTHLANHGRKAPLVDVEGQRQGNRIIVKAQAPSAVRGGLAVYVVTYRPQSTVKIRRGENAGRTLDYANVVVSWTEARPWTGRGDYELAATLPDAHPAVVIFQRPGHGEIVGAIELR